MKAGIHPEYREVVFRDISCNFEFLTKSCATAKDTTTYNGKDYPLITIDISSQSHPYYTGDTKILDTEGRVERYYRKYGFVNPDAPSNETPAESEQDDA
jgi:large subunit ribosomal protein L31